MARLRNTLLLCLCGVALALVCPGTMGLETLKLSSGYDMPLLGLGTWQVKPEDADKAVTAALDSGYKHIDTAWVYENEKAIGDSLKKWFDKGGKREDLFITTKLPPPGIRAADVETYLKDSLNKLGLQYVDMYLVHVPVGFLKDKDSMGIAKNADGSPALDMETDHISLWKAMEAQVKAGRARSIGLSNFNVSQIDKIIKSAEIKPSNVQVELQAYNQQKPLREFCGKNGIAVTAYSSLGSPATDDSRKTESVRKLPRLLDNPIVTEIATAHGKTPAQILLRHQVQNGIVVIPKSTKLERIRENAGIFDFKLTADEMQRMDGLDKGEDGRMFDFLSFKGIEKHPEYPWTEQLKKVQT